MPFIRVRTISDAWRPKFTEWYNSIGNPQSARYDYACHGVPCRFCGQSSSHVIEFRADGPNERVTEIVCPEPEMVH